MTEKTMTITVYVAFDGNEFDTPEACITYERHEFLTYCLNNCIGYSSGDNMTILKGTLWGGESDTLFTMKMDSADKLENILNYVAYRHKGEVPFDIASRLTTARERNEMVLFDFYDSDLIYLGNLDEVLDGIRSDLITLFKDEKED